MGGDQSKQQKEAYKNDALQRQGGGGQEQPRQQQHKDPAAWNDVLDSEENTQFAQNAQGYLKFFLPTSEAKNGVTKQKLTDVILGIDTTKSICLSGIAGETGPDDCIPIVSLAIMRAPQLEKIELNQAHLTVLGLRTLALWLPKAPSLVSVSLQGNKVTPVDCHAFIKDLVEHANREILPKSLRRISLEDNAVWYPGVTENEVSCNGQAEADIQFLSQRCQLSIITPPVPEKPFDVYGKSMQLSQFEGTPPHLTAVVDTPQFSRFPLVSMECDLSGKQDAERKVDDIKRLCDVLINVQNRPLEEQHGERYIARVFYCSKRGSKKLIMVTEDYQRRIAQERSMIQLSEFLAEQQEARVKYPLNNIVDIALQMAKMCEFLHSHDMILMRVLPMYIALDQKTGDIRYMEVQTLRSDTGHSDPATYKHKCEDPVMAKTIGNKGLNKSLDIYALGMFVFYLTCFSDQFKTKVFKFPQAKNQEGADKLLNASIKHFEKQLLESSATHSVPDELRTKIAELISDCMKIEYNTNDILVRRPDVKEFIARLEPIRDALV